MLCHRCEESILGAGPWRSAEESLSHQRFLISWFKKYGENHESNRVSYKTHKTVLHESVDGFRASVAVGCFICHRVEQYIRQRQKDLDLVSEGADLFTGTVLHGRIWLEVQSHLIRVILDENNFSEDLEFVPLSDESPNPSVDLPMTISSTSTSAQPDLWNRWLRECVDHHQECKRLQDRLQPFILERLIEIIPPDGEGIKRWRVVRGADVGLVPYLTLSHCWGSHQPIKLMKDDLTFFQYQNASMLPKTYQDAFDIAISLGFKFLWIDSLCIIQNDDPDWKAQSGLMGSIYQNSTGNIAATHASDGAQGCFSERDLVLSNYATIEIPSLSGVPITYYIVAKHGYNENVLMAPLNRRGWVTQERFLSRRQLNFSRHQVYWVCHELIASEQFPSGMPSNLWSGVTPNNGSLTTLDLEDEEERREAWSTMVSQYSSCTLTRPSDKFIAIAGLVKKLRDATGDEYVAGLWRTDLHKQLLWCADTYSVFKSNRSTEVGCTAPTWSWVNVNGPVIPDFRYLYLTDNETTCSEVVDIIVRSSHPSATHSFMACKLTLRGIATWGNIQQSEKLYESSFHEAMQVIFTHPIASSSSQDGDHPWVGIKCEDYYPDADASTQQAQSYMSKRQANLLFFLLCVVDHEENNPFEEGLILWKIPSSASGENLFERIGVFEASDRSFVGALESRLESHGIKWGNGRLPLDDPNLKDLVQTVTIV